jgi:hypothetical protein
VFCRNGFNRNVAAANTKTDLSVTHITGNTFRKMYNRFVRIEGILPAVIIDNNIFDTLDSGTDGIFLGPDSHAYSRILDNWINECGTAVDVIEIEADTFISADNTCVVYGNTVVGTNGDTCNAAASLLKWDALTSQVKSRVGTISMTDGIAVPTAVTGVALLYVDTNDGDLKIKFADDTIKTITTDT